MCSKDKMEFVRAKGEGERETGKQAKRQVTAEKPNNFLYWGKF